MQQEKEMLKQAKLDNEKRVADGLQPKFLKKREFKELRLRDQFEKLESRGALDKFIEKRGEENERRRAKQAR